MQQESVDIATCLLCQLVLNQTCGMQDGFRLSSLLPELDSASHMLITTPPSRVDILAVPGMNVALTMGYTIESEHANTM